MTEAIDTTAVEDHDPATPVPDTTSTAVVRRERRSEVIRPLDTDQLVESFGAYQALLPRLLTDDDYQSAGGKRFVKKSGWRKIATAFDLDVQIIRSTVDRDEHGQALRAEVWARAIAPSGRSMDGDGYCSVDESRFAQASARQKLENDLRATATTRAMNRAISGLVGMGEVSAEEVDGHSHAQAPAWAAPASQQLTETLRNAMGYLLDEPAEGPVVSEVVRRIAADTDDTLAGAPARAVLYVAAAIKAKRQRQAPA